jgi:alpha-galactosidase
MSYRQDLANFGEPMEGHWDGYQRINFDTKSGGIIGVLGKVQFRINELLQFQDLI